MIIKGTRVHEASMIHHSLQLKHAEIKKTANSFPLLNLFGPKNYISERIKA
jgi:hypothetical protein